ncbi:hypothetical protein CDN99_24220 [Roseateles aquatilis]|uniref:Dystroglycan-type cadherin-like domain-containing protein n=1 Tax=Roseateles aquatilis TaxID=431061 RepID=A0A246IW14_9BURK|nr:Ig domain-containing protein [Roseateles aquatilis]OWQ84405.1 hypothetical protein CDN99_24220 [Roseateles aquatilis]
MSKLRLSARSWTACGAAALAAIAVCVGAWAAASGPTGSAPTASAASAAAALTPPGRVGAASAAVGVPAPGASGNAGTSASAGPAGPTGTSGSLGTSGSTGTPGAAADAVATSPLRTPTVSAVPVPKPSAVPSPGQPTSPPAAPSNLPSTAASSPTICIVPTGDRSAFPSAASDATGGACCCGSGSRGALRLPRPPETLPPARQGRAYLQTLSAEGGRPPYQFTVVDGDLPQDLTLDARGTIAGTPPRVQATRFVVLVTDRAGTRLHQTFDLRVLGARKPEPPASAASAPAVPKPQRPAPLTSLEIAHASAQAASRPTATVYELPAGVVEAIKALIPAKSGKGDGASSDLDAAPSADAGAGTDTPATSTSVAEAAATPAPTLPELPTDVPWTEDQQNQLNGVLQPLLSKVYLTRDLFEDALRARSCEQAWLLVSNEAARLKQSAGDKAIYLEDCLRRHQTAETDRATSATASAPRRKAASASASAPASAASAPTTLKPADVGVWLLPPGLVTWLSQAARIQRPLGTSRLLNWVAAADCGCAAARENQPLYAFYPAWFSEPPPDAPAEDAPSSSDGGASGAGNAKGEPQKGRPQTMDFSVINRISYFALPMADDLALPPGWAQDAKATAFVRTARRHGTRVDLVLYNNDWRFLQQADPAQWAAERQWRIQRLTTRLRELLDTPLPGLGERAKAWLPGFGEAQYLADGVTLVFDDLPARDTQEARRFASFYPAFVRGLAEAMARNPGRQYAINLVMTGNQVTGRPARNADAPFDVATLFELLKAVEKPKIVEGRIVTGRQDYRRDGNVELRFLVLLPEPTTLSKKLLRRTVEESSAVQGTDRRIFLRSIVPVMQVPPLENQQFQDDLAYAEDNFGGMGVWPLPEFNTNNLKDLKSIFGPDPGLGVQSTLCGWICPNRWWVRLAFELLVLAGVVIWVALQLNCGWRQRYGRIALLAGVPPALVAFALSACDPALAFLRDSGMLMLGIAVAALVVFLIVAMLKRKVENP